MSVMSAMTEIRRFAQAVSPTVPPFDEALPHLRAMLDAAGEPYRLVGGIAVIHHGYVRATRDLDVLVSARGANELDALLPDFGFVRESRTRLRHVQTNVTVDLLIGGDRNPRPAQPPYPEPASLPASSRDPEMVGLAGLVELKLAAGRMQDQADIVALLKLTSEAEYIALEAAMPARFRPTLLHLWDEAQQELAWERAAADAEE